MKKYIAELIGTGTLVTRGCGTAMLVGCDAASGSGYLLTALAFGLVIVGMAYCVGNISGCHINPAVSLGVLMSGGMNKKDFVGYVIAQCLGALLGAALLALIFKLGGVTDKTGGIVALTNVSDEEDLMIINRSGITIRMKVADLRVLGRNTQGVKLINLRGKDYIASITKVPTSDEEEAAAETPAEGETPAPSEE